MPLRPTIEFRERRSEPKVFLDRTAWSLVDQAVVSLGTFLVSIILARQLTPLEYGVFALLLAVSFSMQLVNFWLAAYPLGVRLAGARRDECARLSTSSIVVVVVLCVPLSGVVGIALLALGRPDLVLPGVAWFLLAQVQQATRRALLADLCHRTAVGGDAISYLGQVLVVGLVASGGRTLSLAGALYCMAAASTLGAIVQALQLRLVFSGLHAPHRWLIENASLGGWSLATGAVSTLRGYVLFWLLATLSGTVMVASLQAALNVFSLLNPIYFGLANLIPQVTARAFDRRGKQAAWRVARPYILIALPPMLLYLALALWFSPFLLLAFYGQGSPYLQLGHLFPYLAVFTAAMIPAELIICYFLGIRETRLALRINLLGAAAIAFSVPPLFATFGLLEGACLALAAGDLVRLAVAVSCLRQLTDTEGQA